MKKLLYIIFPLLMVTITVTSCGKKPWEHYVAPELIPLPDPEPEPPREKEPARNETFRVKVMSIGVLRNNAELLNNANIINQYNPDVILVREIDRNTTRSVKGVYQDDDLVGYLGNLGKSYYTYFIPIIPGYQGGDFGFTLFSKNEFTDPTFKVLNPNRAGGYATTTVNGYPITFAGAQMDDGAGGSANRTIESGIMYDLIKDIDGPTVLALGLWTTNPAAENGLNIFRPDFASGCTSCANNINVPAANQFIGDHIMFKHMNTEIGEVKVIEYKVHEDAILSRRAVYAELEFTQ
ncbi:MAG TPA: hypothetical protein PKA53_04135 [Sphingobacterium sp.]|nr:hypothetical protein [Sphingobacterium sp.]